MSIAKLTIRSSCLILAVVGAGVVGGTPFRMLAQPKAIRSDIATAEIRSEVNDFLAKEVAMHFADIKTLNPPPEKVFNALTVGDFSWGSFARALAAQADLGGNRT